MPVEPEGAVNEQPATQWPATVRAEMSGAVRRYRIARGWTTERLSKELHSVGAPISRSTLAKMESGERTHFTVAEWLALAYALDVPPVCLLVPFGEFPHRRVVPEAAPALPLDLAAWFSAERPLRRTPDAEAAWNRAVAPLSAVREHDALVSEYRVNEVNYLEAADVDGQRSRRGSSGLPDLLLRHAEISLDIKLRELRRLRRRFEINHWVLPSLDQDIAEAIERLDEDTSDA